jgi:hypothetical protein
MKFQVKHLAFESSFEIGLRKEFVRVRWRVLRLGGAYPGGDWLIKDPELEFRADGREPVRVQLIPSGHPDRTMCGEKCFRRMREMAMPAIPWSYGLNLPAGEYAVRFTGELYDCARLVNYCDAMNIFAGWFSQVVEAFEEQLRLWAKRGHGDAMTPYRFPIDLTLGRLKVPGDRLHAPRYYPLNEAELTRVPWKPAPKLKPGARRSAAPVQPENFFGAQIVSGIGSMRKHGFCRWGTHCNDAPLPPGSVWKGGDRLYGMWGTTFGAHYAVTGDEQSGAAAWYAVRQCLESLKRESAPHHKHCLSFGIATEMMLQFAQAIGRPALLKPVARIWRAWPYDSKRHTMATQPTAAGGDHTPNDTYNMRMKGALAMWLTGRFVGDRELMARGRDCVFRFILPAIQPEGYWYYRPMSPEGEIVNGIMSNNHYDGFVKHMLAKLLLHPEWRKEKGVMATLRRGMDFTIQHLAAQDERTLRWELYLKPQRHPPRVQLAQQLGHAGMFCAPLAVLALYEDPRYLEPLRKSVQHACDLRDAPLLKGYWDNAWLYSLYGGLLTLSRLGFWFEGTPERLTLRLPATLRVPSFPADEARPRAA